MRAGECAEVEDFRIGTEFGERRMKTARGGVVTFAVAGGEQQDFRHEAQWKVSAPPWQATIARGFATSTGSSPRSRLQRPP